MLIVSGWTVLICGVFYLALTRQVILARRSQGVSIGDGNDKLVLRRMRGQANAAEQMPITLIALIVAEMMGASTILLAPMAAVFVLGRLLHGIAFGWLTFSKMRFFGTIFSLAGTGLILAYLAFNLMGLSV